MDFGNATIFGRANTEAGAKAYISELASETERERESRERSQAIRRRLLKSAKSGVRKLLRR
ncbi:hypothetical protein [Arthrobacter castelli]|uniref:hypothetical protein n=1 Tax=Arthrobacter castelli TaxID=271431 RepID=UPI00040F50BC|nr:hypothetical protein [Arthrobacter castelli]